jgi:NitT/TauT family transport system substrate-binding protein
LRPPRRLRLSFCRIVSLVISLTLAPALPAHADITMVLSEWVGDVAWYIAREKGFFEKNGVKVNLVMSSSIDESFAMFDSGKVDANSQPWGDTLVRASQKVPGKAILAVDYSVGADALMVGLNIARISDLRGKKIALEEVAIGQFLLDTALTRSGLTGKDVQVQYMPTGDAAQAFLNGKVQATVVWNPFVNEIQSSRKGRPLFSSKDIPGMISDVIVASDQSVKQKRGEYLRLIKSWYDVERFIRTNRDEAVSIMAKIVKQDAAEYRLFLSGVRLLDEKANLDAFGAESNPRSLLNASKSWIKFLTESKRLRGPLSPSSAIDASLVSEVAKR